MISNHINYPDDKNNIFCYARKSIIHLDTNGKFWKTCTKCKYFRGSYQGEGVECEWDDPKATRPIEYVDDSKGELIRVTQ